MNRLYYIAMITTLLACEVSEDVNIAEADYLRKYYGSYKGNEVANTIMATETGYYIGGYIEDVNEDNNTRDAFVLQLDDQANVVSRYVGNTLQENEEVVDMGMIGESLLLYVLRDSALTTFIDLTILSSQLQPVSRQVIAKRSAGGLRPGGMVIEGQQLYLSYNARNAVQDTVHVVTLNFESVDLSDSLGRVTLEELQFDRLYAKSFINQQIGLAASLQLDGSGRLIYSGSQLSEGNSVRQFISRLNQNGIEESNDFGAVTGGRTIEVTDVRVAVSNEYLVAGTVRYPNTEQTDAYFARISFPGGSAVINDSVFAFTDNSFEEGVGLVQLPDLSFLMIINNPQGNIFTENEGIKPGGSDVGLIKINGNGEIVRKQLFGSSGLERAVDYLVDPMGRVVVIGNTENAQNNNIFLLRMSNEIDLY